MAGLQTEFPFTLPKGYVDGDGMLHRSGTMRLATARDEIEPLRDPRVSGPDDPYLTIIVLSRVITELGTLRQVTTRDVENLFAADLAFLQDLYGIINFGDADDVAALRAALVEDTIQDRLDAEHVGAADVEVVTPPEDPLDGDGDVERATDEPVRRRDRIEEVTGRRHE